MKMTSREMIELLAKQENDTKVCGLCWQTGCDCGTVHQEEDFSTFVLRK